MVSHVSRTPVLPLPPKGAVPVLSAMQEFLPDEWQKWEDLKRQQRDVRERSRTPPGGRRWPETDARHISSIKMRRQAASRAASDAANSAWNDLKRALFDQLMSGDLIAYVTPGSPGDPHRQIPRLLWQELRTVSVQDSLAAGVSVGTIKILIHRAGAGEERPRAAGRPQSQARPIIMDEFRRRREAGEAQDGAHKEAAELIRIQKTTHPELEPPQAQTVARWIREELKRLSARQALDRTNDPE